MNLLKNSLLIAAVAALGACSQEDITTPNRYEEFTREFVKEFGTNAVDKQWLEASSATLNIVADESDQVRVFYKKDGKLCLVGDLTVHAGTNAVPFIIPRDVEELTVESSSGSTTAAVGSTVDITHKADNMYKATSVYPSERSMRFKSDELLKVWFDKVKEGENNLNLPVDDRLSFEGCPKVERGKMLVYLVYKNLTGMLAESLDLNDISVMGYAGDDIGNPINGFYHSSNAIAFEHNAPHSGYFTKENGNQTTSSSKSLTMEVLGGEVSSGDLPSVVFNSSSNHPLSIEKLYHWGENRYWNVTLDNLKSCNYKYLLYAPEEKVTVKTCNGGNSWTERTRNCVFIGVSMPPAENTWSINGNTYNLGSDERPDFCDLIFVAIPEDDVKVGFSNGGAYAGGENIFTIATEDLGGTYDWDFNDAVFEVEVVTKSPTRVILEALDAYDEKDFTIYAPSNTDEGYVFEISVTPLASGGTMPIYIAYNGQTTDATALRQIINSPTTDMYYNDFYKQIVSYNQTPANWPDGVWVIGSEFHKWLGCDDYKQMLNTGEGVTHYGRSTKFYVSARPDNSSDISNVNTPLCGFSVIVDKDNSLGINTTFDRNAADDTNDTLVKFNGELGKDGYQIGAVTDGNNELPPMMLIVPNGWNWPRECVHINDAYSGFAPWIRGEASTWFNRTKPTDTSLVTSR